MVSVIIPALILSDELFDQAKKSIKSVKDGVELIIIDNGSTIGSAYLEKMADIYIHYPDKIGFGVACNAGIKLARGSYIAISSIDVEYLQGNIKDLAEIYDQCKKDRIGIICPSMSNKGQKMFNDVFPGNTEGSTFLLDRETYDKVKLPEGLYDERYVHGYFEDADLWRRMDDLKLICARSGHVLANHHEGTTNKFLGVLDKYMAENKKRYVDKWGEEPTWSG